MRILTVSQLQKDIHAALNAWDDLAGTSINLLEDLLLVQIERQKKSGSSPTTRRLAANQILKTNIDLLRQQDPLGAEILSLRFMDQETVLMVARKLDLSEDQIKRRQRVAIKNLAQIILEHEEVLRGNLSHQMQSQLMPMNYSELFGVEETGQLLLGQLQQLAAPWVIALVGIGGIGKTSLADKVVREVIQDFVYQQIIWLQIDILPGRLPHETLNTILAQLADKLGFAGSPSDKQEERKNFVHQVLKSSPYLIVVDNLESEADAVFLSSILTELSNPSKFLLTSRVRLPASASIMSVLMGELSKEDTFSLIRQQARLRGQNDLAEASENKLQVIYHVAGGNPLAIKLVVGLTDVYPLTSILADLKKAKTREVSDLYIQIYWYAWNSLSEHGQALLEVMPMVSMIGVTPEKLSVMSGLEEEKLWLAISELVNRSLLDVRGTTWERRYTIHRLTESFLFTEIIRWPEKA